jgi:hypothetical protein
LTIPPPLGPEDGEIASRAFGEYLKAEGLLDEITEAQCARLAKVFLHGFAAGSGNAVGKMRAAELERALASAMGSERRPDVEPE